MYPKREYSDMRYKILEGIRIAIHKLIVKAAQINDELVISKNEQIKYVKARDY